MTQSPRELRAVFRGRPFLSFGVAALFVLATSCRVGWAGSVVPVLDDANLALLDCPSGRRLAEVRLDRSVRALASVVPSGNGPASVAVLGVDGVVSLHELPTLRERARRDGMPADGALVTTQGAGAGDWPGQVFVAIGGRRTTTSAPLRLLDAATLSDLHAYRLDPSVEVAALAAVPGRQSLLVGLSRPVSPAEVWEIALSPDAPPVLKGLVHDYRMGEAVALPGQYTPRPAPVGSATAGFAPGPVPYEWLRVAADGRVTVLHLEVRREIARLPDAPGGWLLAPWTAEVPGAGRGWVVGEAGGSTLRRFDSVSWQLSEPVALPGALLALTDGLEPGTVVAVIEQAGADLKSMIGEVDAVSLGFRARVEVAGQVQPGVRLLRAIDRRCLALVNPGGRWLGALSGS